MRTRFIFAAATLAAVAAACNDAADPVSPEAAPRLGSYRASPPSFVPPAGPLAPRSQEDTTASNAPPPAPGGGTPPDSTPGGDAGRNPLIGSGG